MSISSLKAISPIDGRYRSKIEELSEFFSEKALIKYRLLVEIEYFISLTEIKLNNFKKWDIKMNESIRDIYRNFNDNDAKEVKMIEKSTNHDVKAVEYFIKNKFKLLKLEKFSEYIHFGLTSQDINNTAIPMSIKDFMPFYNSKINELISELEHKVNEYSRISMLARTHGQPASPTRLGKEIDVFKTRIKEQFKVLESIPISCKFGGATGNLNAHKIAFPEINWIKFRDLLKILLKN